MSRARTSAPPEEFIGPLPPPKILRRQLPVVESEAVLVPARMINEVLYCERLAYLEWVQGEFEHNHFTIDGREVHRKVDQAPQRRRKKSKKASKTEEEATKEAPFQARSLWLSSERLGITAKLDVVDDVGEGRVAVVEYKRGSAPEIPEGAWLPERAQLCAQVLLARDAGLDCVSAEIYFAADRRRVPIAIDDALIEVTMGAVSRLRALRLRDEAPPPLVDSPKCSGCSLVGICLPDEVTLMRRLDGQEPAPPAGLGGTLELPFAPDITGPMERDPWGLAGGEPVVTRHELRRLVPARDDRVPLYVQAQGAQLRIDGEVLVVATKDGPIEARVANTSQVSLFGNIQVTAQAMRTLIDHGIPLSYFSYGGWFVGRTIGFESKNVELRVAQYAAAGDEALRLRLARRFVQAKIVNARTMLRRNAEGELDVDLFELKQLARKATEAASVESLLGIEGTAARRYFSCLPRMIKPSSARVAEFDMDGRNRRPPRDPVNAMLSLAYALLTKEWTVAVTSVGLDPMRCCAGTAITCSSRCSDAWIRSARNQRRVPCSWQVATKRTGES